VHVLPEDDANKDLATGFELAYEPACPFRVLPPANGWHKVLECFVDEHVPALQQYTNRFMILLIDFDNDAARLPYAKSQVPEELAGRVFVLGVISEPEKLRSAMGRSLEEVGRDLARDCVDGTDTTWSHDLLCHNAAELERLRARVRPILFPGR
jgi:hypothetical protein